MGRPPLNFRSTNVRLPNVLRERIEALVGPRRMAEFIRRAIESELERQEAQLAEDEQKKKAASQG
ncbi:hypothetical protein HLH36_18705 [Gluconacetobacter aggeris]|uniref:Uncharacterized protein n=2 Tax=Gluconacetobacter TaxID=89583 RepID=A0A7W4IKK7_9PROT|nr:hypothetical protein [Gluconacetobacter dulcium]MBB2170347.1 hypothetical protein [Gluconacetobacter aggeris]MBB2193614.1 hypothetical protein [Gluconacetobacter dulcium]